MTTYNKSFLDRFCDAFGCVPGDCSEKVLWLCVFPHASLLARWLWRHHRSLFAPDIELIQHIQNTHSLDELQVEVNDAHYHNHPHGFLRGLLRVRLSKKRLLVLGAALFRAEKSNGARLPGHRR